MSEAFFDTQEMIDRLLDLTRRGKLHWAMGDDVWRPWCVFGEWTYTVHFGIIGSFPPPRLTWSNGKVRGDTEVFNFGPPMQQKMYDLYNSVYGRAKKNGEDEVEVAARQANESLRSL
jgi:hypothetical protein